MLAVGEYIATQGYLWTGHHLPYLWEANDSKNTGLIRGVDCSNFTALVYNYATGYRMSSAIRTQAGQTGTALAYDTPNLQSQATRDGLELAGGKLVREDGTVDGQASSARFLSAFDNNGNLGAAPSFAMLASTLRPGDLLYFSWGSDGDPQRVRHAAIWTGQKIGTDVPLSHVTSTGGVGANGDWLLVHGGAAIQLKGMPDIYRTYLWGVRRVINDDNDPTEFMNTSFEKLSGMSTYTRVSHYLDDHAFSYLYNSKSYVMSVDGEVITRRRGRENTYQSQVWVDPTGHHKSQSEPLTGIAKKWGWLFASDSDTLYKLSYVSNTGTWEAGVIHWQYTGASSIVSLSRNSSALVVTLADGSTVDINLSGNPI